jgi:hypothetical protein
MATVDMMRHIAQTGENLKLSIERVAAELGSLINTSAEMQGRDAEILQQLRSACNIPFQRDAEGERLLRDIWNAAFPINPIENFDIGDHWKRLGFQSRDPFTDIRAGGLAPHQLHHFASKYPHKLQLLVEESNVLGYPFACSCFNVSQMIVAFFSLYDRPAMNPVAGGGSASSIQKCNLTRFCSSSCCSASVILDELFCALVLQLHGIWNDMHHNGSSGIMDFPIALRSAYESNSKFWRSAHTDIDDLRQLSEGSRSLESSCVIDFERLGTLFWRHVEGVLQATSTRIDGAIRNLGSQARTPCHTDMHLKGQAEDCSMLHAACHKPPMKVSLLRRETEDDVKVLSSFFNSLAWNSDNNVARKSASCLDRDRTHDSPSSKVDVDVFFKEWGLNDGM